MKKLKMLTSILLTLVLCLGFVMPAFAVESNRDNTNYSITIDHARTGHKYEAYQVFSADHTVKNEKDVLSNIEWGSAIVKKSNVEGEADVYNYSAELIAKLRTNNTFKTAFEALETEGKTITAEEVIKVLDKAADESDIVKDFSKAVGDLLVTKGEEPDKTTSGAYGEDVAEAYKISGLKPGYFVVLDKAIGVGEDPENPNNPSEPVNGDAYSRFMVKVAGNTSVTVKSIQPTLTKTAVSNPIVNKVDYTAEEIAEKGLEADEDGNYPKKEVPDTKNNTAKTGDDVDFKLESNVPDMTGYETFTFKVTDKLSKGFTFKANTLKVKIGDAAEVAPEKLADYEAKTDEEKKSFAIVYSEATDETTKETTVTIDFKNMEKITANQGSAITKPVTLGDAIVITYKATLNNDAEKGIIPNTNEAKLTYSNDPKAVGEGEKPTKDTPTEVTNTYSIGLGLTKFDVEDEKAEKTKLAGAQFLVYDGPETEEDRKVLGIMLSSSEGIVSLMNAVEADGEYTVGDKEITLSEGTYYLKETKAPDGFNLLKGELEVTLDATTAKTDSTTTVTWTANIVNKNSNDAGLAGSSVKAVDGVSYADLQIANKAGFQLPSTGGVGTVIFTVIGVLVMAAVVVIAVKSNKK